MHPMEEALRYMPCIPDSFRVAGLDIPALKEGWRLAVRSGNIVETPPLRTVEIRNPKASIGCDLLANHTVSDPFCAPWMVVYKTPIADHISKASATLFSTAVEGEELRIHYSMYGMHHRKDRFTMYYGGVFPPHRVEEVMWSMEALDAAASANADVKEETLRMWAQQATGDYLNVVGMLNTRGISYDVTETRIDKKKDVVKRVGRIRPNSLYFTDVSETRPKKNTPGGTSTHASPRPHLRRGHIRNVSGGTTWVRPHMVNVASEGELAFLERKRYRIK